MAKKKSFEPGRIAERAARRRRDLKGEFVLAALPTLTVLTMLGMVEALSRQRVLFATLAASAFLVYLGRRPLVRSGRAALPPRLRPAGA